MSEPANNGADGVAEAKRVVVRDEKGRLTKGSAALNYKGNGGGHTVQYFRKAVREAVTEEDVAEIMEKMIGQAKAGSIPAASLVLDRVAGKATTNLKIEEGEKPSHKDATQSFDELVDREPKYFVDSMIRLGYFKWEDFRLILLRTVDKKPVFGMPTFTSPAYEREQRQLEQARPDVNLNHQLALPEPPY